METADGVEADDDDDDEGRVKALLKSVVMQSATRKVVKYFIIVADSLNMFFL
jgi:hypothetical protein